MTPILLCSDLDRTLLPNGREKESPQARPLLHALAKEDWLQLVYVSGRSKKLMEEAIEHYELPWPDFAITDVGTMIFEPKHHWHLWQKWHEELDKVWPLRHTDALLHDIAHRFGLVAQEPEKQGRYKLSFYTHAKRDDALLTKLATYLKEEGLTANIIFSVDTETGEGLLDILPQKANKLFAIRFLMKSLGFTRQNTLFAGDSGNDMEVLVSDIPSVLVANATDAVKKDAIAQSQSQGHLPWLYLAKGNFFGMNGNYAAGVLEGLCHFHPEIKAYLAKMLA